MKAIGTLVAFALAAACNAVSEPPSQMVSAKAFFESCAGWNFTYESALAGTLEDMRIPRLDAQGLEPEELERHLDRALADSGLEAQPVGPPELKTLLIRRAG